jgi:hypothetical protein
MSDDLWQATLRRVRSEFEEMPALRVTRNQARSLFGLSASASEWVLNRLAIDGFLDALDSGEFVRKRVTP